MDKTITVSVTQELVQRGVRKSPCFCPVALALNQAGLDGVGVRFGGSIFFKGCGFLLLPENARRFIERFDAGYKPRPFSFRLKVPAGCARRRKINATSRTSHND